LNKDFNLCSSSRYKGLSIPTEIYNFSDNFSFGMLCPNLATQGQVIDESTKG
jgi:hypothetical protein